MIIIAFGSYNAPLQTTTLTVTDTVLNGAPFNTPADSVLVNIGDGSAYVYVDVVPDRGEAQISRVD